MNNSTLHLRLQHPQEERRPKDDESDELTEIDNNVAEVLSPKRSFHVSDSSPFIRQRKKSRSSPFLLASPRERADSVTTNGSVTQIYEWSPISANTELMISPVFSINSIRKSSSTAEFHGKSPRSRNDSFVIGFEDHSRDVSTPILKHADDLDLLQEVSFSSNPESALDRVEAHVPTFESIINDQRHLDVTDDLIDHPHFLPPNSDEFLLLPQIQPVVARRDIALRIVEDEDKVVSPTPTALLAQLKI